MHYFFKSLDGIMPLFSKLDINLQEVANISQQVSNKIDVYQRGFLTKLNSELKRCEQNIANALQQKVNLADSSTITHNVHEPIIEQYKELNNFLTQIIPVIQQQLQVSKQVEFSNALEKINTILIEHQKLIQKKIQIKSSENHVWHEEVFEFCKFLGGKCYQLSQDDDPFIGGTYEKGITKNSGGFCGGLVIGWILKYLQTGKVSYPIIGNQQIQHYQNEQAKFKEDEMALCYKSEFTNTSFNKLLGAMNHRKAYYLSMQSESSDTGHAAGLKSFADGSFHFYEPNFGAFYLPNFIRMRELLSFYFAKLRREGFPSDTFTLYESIKEVANPESEPTPSRNDYFTFELAIDYEHRNQQIDHLLITEIETLVKGMDLSTTKKEQALRNCQTFFNLILNQVHPDTSHVFLESMRYILLYLETGDKDNVLAHLELLANHNPLQVDISRVKEIVNKLDKMDAINLFPQLDFNVKKHLEWQIQSLERRNKKGEHTAEIANYKKSLEDAQALEQKPQLQFLGSFCGATIRRLFCNTQEQNYRLQKQIKSFIGILTTVDNYVLGLIAQCKDKLQTSDTPPETKAELEVELHVLTYFYDKLQSSNLKKYALLIGNLAIDQDAFISLQDAAEQLIPGITGKRRLAESNDSDVQFDINQNNVPLLIDQHLQTLRDKGYQKQVVALDKFSQAMTSYLKASATTSAKGNTLMSYWSDICIETFATELTTFQQELMVLKTKLKNHEVELLDLDKPLSTILPITLRVIHASNEKSEDKIETLLLAWFNTLPAFNTEGVPSIEPIFNLLIADNGKLLVDRMEMILQTMKAEYRLTDATVTDLRRFLQGHINQLRQYFDSILKTMLHKDNAALGQEMLQTLATSLQTTFGVTCNTKSDLVESSAWVVPQEVKDTMHLINQLQHAIQALTVHLQAVTSSGEAVLGADKKPPTNYPLDKLVRQHYKKSSAGINDLLQSTQAQLDGLLNNTRNVEDVSKFMQSQFTYNKNQLEVEATIRDKFSVDIIKNQAVTKLVRESLPMVRKKIADLTQTTQRTKSTNNDGIRNKLTSYEQSRLFDAYVLTQLSESLAALDGSNEQTITALLQIPSCYFYGDKESDEQALRHQEQKEQLIAHFLASHPSVSELRKNKLNEIYSHVNAILSGILKETAKPDSVHFHLVAPLELANIRDKITKMRAAIEHKINELSVDTSFYSENDLINLSQSLHQTIGCTVFDNDGHVHADLKEQVIKTFKKESSLSLLFNWFFPKVSAFFAAPEASNKSGLVPK